jgi:hypothetical protein
MRAWIGVAPLHQNPAGRDHLRRALLLIVLPDETPVRSPRGRVVCTACGLIGADVQPQTKRSNFRWEQGAM